MHVRACSCRFAHLCVSKAELGYARWISVSQWRLTTRWPYWATCAAQRPIQLVEGPSAFTQLQRPLVLQGRTDPSRTRSLTKHDCRKRGAAGIKSTVHGSRQGRYRCAHPISQVQDATLDEVAHGNQSIAWTLGWLRHACVWSPRSGRRCAVLCCMLAVAPGCCAYGRYAVDPSLTYAQNDGLGMAASPV